MLVKEGENVVITADTSADFRVVEAVAGAAYSVGANPVIIHYPTSGKAFEEPIRPVADAVEHADVWIELAYYCSMHTPCFKKALENGARFTAFATDEERINWHMFGEHRPMYGYYEKNNLIGYYSLLLKDNGECELNNLSVLPEYRHNKIGYSLLEHSFESISRILFSSNES